MLRSLVGSEMCIRDRESIAYKVNNIVKKYGMKGYMFWALDLDDSSGRVCKQGRYPLMNAAKKASMGNPINLPICKNINACGTTQTTKSPTDPINPTGKCKSAGPWKGSASMDRWCSTEEICRLACTKPCPVQAVCLVSINKLL